jgi:type I restriction enzyme S subunit
MQLGDLLIQIDERNEDGSVDNLLGVAIEKHFMPSVANVVGTDLSTYKLLKKDRFACNPMHVGRDEKLPITFIKNRSLRGYDGDNAEVRKYEYILYSRL